MKFCQPHWRKLSTAIRDRGLWHLVATSGQEAVLHMRAESFEPLIGAHNTIMSNAIQTLGLFEGCPVCELKKHDDAHRALGNDCCTDRPAFDPIERTADEALRQAMVRGLAPDSPRGEQ